MPFIIQILYEWAEQGTWRQSSGYFCQVAVAAPETKENVMRTLAFFTILACLVLSGCGASTKSQMIEQAAIHENISVSLNWQRATQVVKTAYDESHSLTLHCMLYNELGEAECIMDRPAFGGGGYNVVIQIKKTSDNASTVDMYSYVAAGYLRRVFADVITALRNAEKK